MEHTSFEAYHTAVMGRVRGLMELPSIGGLDSVIEDLMDSESDIGERGEVLLNVLTIIYTNGRADEHRSNTGQAEDDDDLKVIDNYRGLPPEEEPSP